VLTGLVATLRYTVFPTIWLLLDVCISKQNVVHNFSVFSGLYFNLYHNNKHRSNLSESEIVNSSFVFARWQHRTDGLAIICK